MARFANGIPLVGLAAFLFAVLTLTTDPRADAFFGGGSTPPKPEPEEETDYYAVLQLPEREDSSEKEIKSNWRKLSRDNHPDVKGEATREAYKTIQRAYEVLSDKRKRKIYDMKGEEGLKQLEKNGGQQPRGNDVMSMFFGGGGGRNDASRGADMNSVMQVTLEDVYNGASHVVRLRKQRLCKKCRGLGAASKADMTTCSACNGKGTTVQRIQLAPGFVQQVEQECPKCGGKGKSIKKKCPVCKGAKVTQTKQALHVDIEQGIPEGHKITFEMEGDQTPDQIPGDVIFSVMTVAHPRFRRNGNDLETTVKLTLSEALLGFTKTIQHLDGHTVELTSTGTTQFGEKQKIASEGMPLHNVPSERGTLTVIYEVELPNHVSSSQRAALEAALP